MSGGNANPARFLINREIHGKLALKDTFFKDRLAAASTLYQKNLLGHYHTVNAIEFSKDGQLLASGKC